MTNFTLFMTKMTICAAAVASFGAAGCAVAPVTGSDSEPVTENVASSGQALTLPNPNGTYFASVTANGTGCPAGTWDASIGEDGQTFTVRFSAYEASIAPGQLLAVKDCQLAISLHSPQGLSYSVSDLYYSGYAFLDKDGMTGRQTAKYYFQGNPIDSSDGRTDMVGPHDMDYTFHDVIGVPDLVWSKCGTTRNLNVATRIRLQNDSEKAGTGYINTSAVDGSISLTFRLAWKKC